MVALFLVACKPGRNFAFALAGSGCQSRPGPSGEVRASSTMGVSAISELSTWRTDGDQSTCLDVSSSGEDSAADRNLGAAE